MKDLYKGLSQLSGFHQNVDKHSKPQRDDHKSNGKYSSLMQEKIHNHKHRHPQVLYYVQEGGMESYMDEFLDQEDKPKSTQDQQASEALTQGKSEVTKAADSDNFVMTTIDLKNINN